MRQRHLLLAGYLALVAVMLILGGTAALSGYDLWLLDHELRLLREWRVTPPAKDVVLIGIDDETARSLPEPMALWHRQFADLLRALTALGPAAVGLDVVLPERSYDSIAPGYDRELIRGLALARSAYPLILGITLDSARHPRPLLPAFEAAVGGADSTGLVLWRVDPDHIVRRFDERLAEADASVPTFVGQLARRLGREPGRGIIDYSVGAPLDYLSMQSVLAAWRAGQIEHLRSTIAGKVVLIGPLFQFEDRIAQPLSLAAWEKQRADAPGLVLHAQALRSILGKGLIRELPAPWSIAFALALSLLWFVPLNTWRAVMLLLLPAGALLVLAVLLLSSRFYLQIGLPVLAIVAAVTARGGYQAVLSLQQRRRLRAALSGYVSPHVADEVLAGRLSAGFEGQRYRLCVMFVDMRNFTPRSERMAPEEVIRLVNRCFEELVGAVHQFGGTVVQFMGDGIEAFFGAPNRLENPARPAFESAKEILRRMGRLNAQLRCEGTEAIRLGIGLNLGDAVVGHVGARSRHGYQPIGDMVNVASRLEGLTKEVGYPLVCSRGVALAVGEGHGLIPLGDRAIKGHSAVSIYGWGPEQDSDADLVTKVHEHAAQG
jgi:adenylate cyclase